ncbi:hypothetical protein C2G38_2073820 [Gigaspora rosea]|uniref:Uncharacterized protein n=1 Tax=Gigaspora rosea TaxID=44941 RepID=A0A397VM78_9GLOM|nr:hypothetical protein C2G38_2073820 [Gigaspora rosea]
MLRFQFQFLLIIRNAQQTADLSLSLHVTIFFILGEHVIIVTCSLTCVLLCALWLSILIEVYAIFYLL